MSAKPASGTTTDNNNSFSFYDFYSVPSTSQVSFFMWASGFSVKDAEKMANTFISLNTENSWKNLKRGWHNLADSFMSREKYAIKTMDRVDADIRNIHRRIMLEPHEALSKAEQELKDIMLQPDYTLAQADEYAKSYAQNEEETERRLREVGFE